MPPPYPGMMRKVYPGFVQLTNFVSMNLEKHMESMNQLFDHLVRGDEEEAEKKTAFYDEYLSVMDLPAEFYLQTVKTVFQDHALPKGEMTARWQPVNRTASCAPRSCAWRASSTISAASARPRRRSS